MINNVNHIVFSNIDLSSFKLPDVISPMYKLKNIKLLATQTKAAYETNLRTQMKKNGSLENVSCILMTAARLRPEFRMEVFFKET